MLGDRSVRVPGLVWWFSVFIPQQALLYLFFLYVHDYSRTTGNEAASERYQQLQCNNRSKEYNGDFAKTKVFKIEKLALLRTTLCDPAHISGVSMHRVRTICRPCPALLPVPTRPHLHLPLLASLPLPLAAQCTGRSGCAVRFT